MYLVGKKTLIASLSLSIRLFGNVNFDTFSIFSDKSPFLPGILI